jgi:hypothetical protein
MAGRLPEAVRWRRGKEHLGWAFTLSFARRTQARLVQELEGGWELLSPYVDPALARAACKSYVSSDAVRQVDRIYDMAHLAAWLRRHAERPQPVIGIFSRS